jgi:hypothetical protein
MRRRRAAPSIENDFLKYHQPTLGPLLWVDRRGPVRLIDTLQMKSASTKRIPSTRYTVKTAAARVGEVLASQRYGHQFFPFFKKLRRK